MKRHLTYRSVFRRRNFIKEGIFNLFLSIASYPRAIIEVFLRKNMGERYFSLFTCIIVALFLMLFPAFLNQGMSVVSRYRDMYDYGGGYQRPGFWSTYIMWYLYAAAFIFFTYLRWNEVKRNPSVFDFKRYSLSTGEILPVFNNIKVGNTTLSIRTVEIFVEPAPFFLVGLVLYLMSQNFGIILMISAICYCLSYAAAYYDGDNYTMDKIDHMIATEEANNAFVLDEDPKDNRGFRFFTKRPTSEEARQRVVDSFFENDEDFTVAT